MELLEDLFEQAARDVLANGFASVSIRLPNPTRERIQHARAFLLDRRRAWSFSQLEVWQLEVFSFISCVGP